MSPPLVPPSSVSRLPCVSFCEIEESATFFDFFECTTANNYSSFDESDDDSDDNSVVDEIEFIRTESPIAIHHQRAYWSCQRGHHHHHGEYKPPEEGSNSNFDEDSTGSLLKSLSEDELLVTKASSSLGTTSTTTSKVQDILRKSQERARRRQRKDCQQRNGRGGSRRGRPTNSDANRDKRLDANGSRSQRKTELQRQNEQTPTPRRSRSRSPTKKHMQTRKQKQTQPRTLKKKETRDPKDPSSPSPRSKPSPPSSPTSNKEKDSSRARRSHGKNRFFQVVRYPTLFFKKTRTTDSGSTESSGDSTAMTSVTDGDQSQNSVQDYFAPPTFHEPSTQQNSKDLVSILRRESYSDDTTYASSCRLQPRPQDIDVSNPAAAIASCGVRFAEGTKFEGPDHVYRLPRRVAKRCVHPRKQRRPTTRRYQNLSIDDIYALDRSFYEFR